MTTTNMVSYVYLQKYLILHKNDGGIQVDSFETFLEGIIIYVHPSVI